MRTRFRETMPIRSQWDGLPTLEAVRHRGRCSPLACHWTLRHDCPRSRVEGLSMGSPSRRFASFVRWCSANLPGIGDRIHRRPGHSFSGRCSRGRRSCSRGGRGCGRGGPGSVVVVGGAVVVVGAAVVVVGAAVVVVGAAVAVVLVGACVVVGAAVVLATTSSPQAASPRAKTAAIAQ